MRQWLMVLAFLPGLALAVEPPPYCLAVRGNGELAPAHWGAMARVVEQLGLPQAQAGGSSASINMFLLDAIASHPLVREANGSLQRQRAAFLLKSLDGFADYLLLTSEFQEFRRLYLQAQNVRNTDWLGTIDQILNQALRISPAQAEQYVRRERETLRQMLDLGISLGLLSPTNQAALIESVRILADLGEQPGADVQFHARRAGFYLGELRETLRVFGKFDAESDVNLFFRPGLVDFNRFARQIARVAQFYSGSGSDATVLRLWRELDSECRPASRGVLWDDLRKSRPQCEARFFNLISAHLQNEPHTDIAMRPLGINIASFPTTAVLMGRAYSEASAALSAYQVELDPSFGQRFRLQNPDDVRFGYWGEPSDLRRISSALPADDAKSLRFYPLGRTSWFEAISLSPAEPGLAPLQRFRAGGQDLISAGGWSDLHPTLVLRAYGCGSIVYLTRRGGESLFGQGVAKRLLNLDERSWDHLRGQPEEIGRANAIRNNRGDTGDMNSVWSRLYNMANPNSSLRRSIADADAVLCTDWNSYDAFKGIKPLIRDAYQDSLFHVRPTGSLARVGLGPVLDPKLPHKDGYPAYAGCY